MRPLWKQVPEVLARYTSETLGLSGFRLRGLFGSQPLAHTLATSIDWEALHGNVELGVIESVSVTATSVRTGASRCSPSPLPLLPGRRPSTTAASSAPGSTSPT
jgi:hypothetical protein